MKTVRVAIAIGNALIALVGLYSGLWFVVVINGAAALYFAWVASQ